LPEAAGFQGTLVEKATSHALVFILQNGRVDIWDFEDVDRQAEVTLKREALCVRVLTLL
jgi:hypothetical protein